MILKIYEVYFFLFFIIVKSHCFIVGCWLSTKQFDASVFLQGHGQVGLSLDGLYLK